MDPARPLARPGPAGGLGYPPSVATCLVTGGAGFLGSHLCDELLTRGNRVICVDNLETGSLANIEHIRKRARFVLASTSEVYGDPHEHPQPETYWGHVNPIGPRGVYDEAKRYAEALTMAYHRQQGVDTGIVRTFNTYGSRMRPHDGRAIPTFLRQALQDKPLTVFGDGSQTRSFCYVDDQIAGYVAMANSDVHA